MRFVLAVLLLVGLALPAAGQGRKAAPGNFDYTLLVLSWSPQYCADQGDRAPAQQCGPDRRFGFVVHGLWPQYSNGGWPENCSTERVSDQMIGRMLDIMPSRQLVIHEWRKHGTCSGQSADDYFGTIRKSFTGISIPDRYRNPAVPVTVGRQQLIDDFLTANPRMPREAIRLKCRRSELEEIAVCMARDGVTPQACGKLNYSCHSETLRLAAVRSAS
jgi:ribonuclease T2